MIKINLFKKKFDYKGYWVSDNLKNIIPRNQGEFPEGWNARDYIKKITNELEFDSVLDFGCGYGRLSKAFSHDIYKGVDLNPNALKRAKLQNPKYSYLEVNIESDLPKCQLILAYTVFLHLDTSTLKIILKKMRETDAKYIIISEIMSREWRRPGKNPPVFSREKIEYIKLMKNIGYSLLQEYNEPYNRYVEDANFKQKIKDITFLIFEIN